VNDPKRTGLTQTPHLEREAQKKNPKDRKKYHKRGITPETKGKPEF